MSWQPPSAPPPGGYTPPPGGYGPPPGGYGPPPGYPAYPVAPYGSPGPGSGLVYASFGRRLGGYLIDILILGVISVVAFLIVFGSTLSPWFNQVSANAQAGLAAPPLPPLPTGEVVAFGIVAFVFTVLYFGVLVGAWGGTLGQRAVGVRVVRQEDTSTLLPLGRAVLRAIIWWGPALLYWSLVLRDLAGLVVLLALLWVIWDPRNQGLHDKLGQALVVRPGLPPLVAAYGNPVYPYAYPPSPAPAPGPPQYPPPYPPQYPPAPPTGP
ncbi:MAG: RDD family protein [Candidatus Dormibacteria bacterium]